MIVIRGVIYLANICRNCVILRSERREKREKDLERERERE